MSALQARVVADATDVIDHLSEQLGGGDAHEPIVGTDPVGEQQLRAASARLTDLFAGLMQDGVEAYIELAQSLLLRPAAAPAGSPAGLSLRGAPGAFVATTVWIHAAEQDLARDVPLRLSDLESPAGGRIAGAQARFAPTQLRARAGESASSLLTLTIPPQAGPGTYFGHVLAGGQAAAAVALQLVVEPLAA